jgi:methionine synthase II (cobalamin-independent)
LPVRVLAYPITRLRADYGLDFCSEKMVEGWAADKSNQRSLESLLDLYISTYNQVISEHVDKIHFGLHICRGNFLGSRHFSEGGYDRIATKLFQDLKVPTYYLEYDTPRAGTFEPMRHLPAHKRVVLGIVTSKFPRLEDKSEMRARVEAAAEVMAAGSGQTKEQALDRLSVSPQCGFASHEEGNSLGMEDMKNKLRLVREIANDIWPSQP